MKKNLKSFIVEIIKYLNVHENKLSIHHISVYFSVVIAAFSLRNQEKKFLPNNNYNNEIDISKELKIIQDRFPELVELYFNTNSILKKQTMLKIYNGIDNVFKYVNEDIDDLISWTYQFLKKDLEKKAFKKVGKDKVKIENSDLLFTTQFFTDKYMVKYLVDRSLSSLNKSSIEKIVVIDCASGGGNFLNYTFECLLKIYKKSYPNRSNQQIVDTIFNQAILGYDLDCNLSKIACLSLFVKASN